ncbi:unnamed protein product [Polarella glacialis]|uniref:Uncharacterized protein n=1 Tax=Polarella glacialis TaxID=89957 RepID=A0A813E975_POLGL|nr:unnamed protein product [Polarella glacialis]
MRGARKDIFVVPKIKEGKRCSIDRPERKTEIQKFRHRKRKGGARKPENETPKGGQEKYLKGGQNQRDDEKKTNTTGKNTKNNTDKKGHQTNNEEEKPTGTKKTDNAEPNSSQV